MLSLFSVLILCDPKGASRIAATTEGELVRLGVTQEGEEALLSSSHHTAAIPHGKPRGSSECEKS